MRPSDPARRVARIAFGILLLWLGIQALLPAISELMVMLMFVGGVVLAGLLLPRLLAPQGQGRARAARRPRTTTRPSQRRPQSRGRTPTRQPGQMHPAAAKAVQRAGHDPDDLPVAPLDMGLLVYSGEGNPTPYRDTPPPDDADYVRPFVVLRSPRRAQGKIRFEIVDAGGTRRFIDESDCELQRGETFLSPRTWLPLRNVDSLGGQWELRVYGAGVLLATHTFRWRDTGGGEFRRYLNDDGEIKDELVEELSHARLEPVSLDELLDEDEDDLLEDLPTIEAEARRARQANRRQRRR